MPAVTIQVRRDTAANWTSANPTLAAGEWALETDTAKIKLGDGTTAWTSLAYAPSVLQYPTLAAGTATANTAPIKFTAGTNLTTPEAGAIEYDGSVFYGDFAASARGTIPNESFIWLNSTNTLTSQTAAQALFDNAVTNGAITLPVGTYQFECFYSLSSMSASSGSFGFAIGGTATATERWWSAAQKGAATLTTATGLQFTYNTTSANTTLATASVNTVGYAWIKGTTTVTAAGTFIPQVSLGVAAAAVVGIGSYIKISPISGTTGANIVIGDWS
jgi:hypothetical protein